MKVSFIVWYNNDTPQIVDVLKSIVPSSGPVKISILAIKTSVGRQLEDSAVRWTPGCQIMYAPGSSKKLAWQHGVNFLITSGIMINTDFVFFCDPYFLVETPIFSGNYIDNQYRFYVPYSNQYGEQVAEDSDKFLEFNAGGSM